jgi:hypothetical protein
VSLDKALDELMDGDIIVFQKYVPCDSSVTLYSSEWVWWGYFGGGLVLYLGTVFYLD